MIKVIEARTEDDHAACHMIRNDVFCREQGISIEFEFDGLDDICRHYLAKRHGAPVGTARARRLDDGVVKAERMAVLADCRGLNVGRELMSRLLEDARREGCRSALLNAQTAVVPFYEKLGFVAEGEEFHEVGIPHFRMTKHMVGQSGR